MNEVLLQLGCTGSETVLHFHGSKTVSANQNKACLSGPKETPAVGRAGATASSLWLLLTDPQEQLPWLTDPNQQARALVFNGEKTQLSTLLFPTC